MEKSLTEEEKEYLNDAYFNPKKSESFSSPQKLYRYVKNEGKFHLTLNSIKKWLQSQEVYTTNKRVSRKINRRKVFVAGIDAQWDLDTANLYKLSKYNMGYGYFILAIDIMSRYVWTKPIKSTTGKEVSKVLKEIFAGDRIPKCIRTDKGTEYSNSIVKETLANLNIKHFVTQNETKSNYSERAILSIKSRIMRYMRSRQTNKWVDVLNDITNGYNNAFHRSIGKAPAKFNKTDEIIMIKKSIFSQLRIPRTPVGYKFKVGDLVRVSKLRHAFHRYYSEHWTNEYFIIKSRSLKQYIPAYTLTDYGGEEIKGIFYEEELQRIFVDENTTYNVEKILKRRKRSNGREVFVKWFGWPNKFSSWIPEKELKKYR
jgi:hypothetical protein